MNIIILLILLFSFLIGYYYYRQSRMLRQFMSEGRSNEKKDFDYDPLELEKGIKVEYEHCSNYHIARKIALDHLAENPKYYEYLEEMEKKL